MKLRLLVAIILMFGGIVFLFSGCASGKADVTMDKETGEIIE